MSPLNDDLAGAADELTTLKARADMLGVSYHPSIGLAKLRDKVAAALQGEPSEPDTAEPANISAAVGTKSEAELKLERQQEAAKLVRIRVQCMNPLKKEWDGEIFTVGNSEVGTFKKFVPFNVDEGWHVPHIMYEHILGKEYQSFYRVKGPRGMEITRTKITREFAVEVLPPLTVAELEELARRQAMAKSID